MGRYLLYDRMLFYIFILRGGDIRKEVFLSAYIVEDVATKINALVNKFNTLCQGKNYFEEDMNKVISNLEKLNK